MALKKYKSLQLDEMTRMLHWLDSYPDPGKENRQSSASLLAESSCFHELLSPHFQAFSVKAEEWLSEAFEHNTYLCEHLIHHTLAGHMVRSKSEVIIANALFTNRIPYRYECAFRRDEVVLFPDFTILHPKTGALIYWEHFGRMDDCAYSEKACNKLKVYTRNGIIPSIHLITTYETSEHPLDSGQVEKIIAQYFL